MALSKVSLHVKNLYDSKLFYQEALHSLGYKFLEQVGNSCAFGPHSGQADFFIRESRDGWVFNFHIFVNS
jgi:hypothetical protein